VQKTISVPFAESFEYHFGIALRSEFVTAPFKLLPQVAVIVDFAIEHDDGLAVVTGEWLVAAAQVYDLQPNCAERDMRRFENTLLVGSAMRERCCDADNRVAVDPPPLVSKSRNSTHESRILRRSSRRPAIANF
jgi:hypothetical protein